MLKIAIGFVVFAALALYILSRGGGDIDMSGEKHGTEAAAAHSEVAASAATAPASVAASSVKP